VDGRDKPGHDVCGSSAGAIIALTG